MAVALQWPVVKTLRILLIATAAYAGALTVSAIADYWLDAPLPQLAIPPSGPAADASRSQGRGSKLDTRTIFERNLFGSETGTTEGAATAVAAPAAAATLALKGTAEIEGRGFAVFAERDSGRQDIFAAGEKIFDGPELVAVFPRSAVILVDGRHRTLELEEGPESPRPAKAVYDAGPAAAAPLGIRKTGQGSYLVDRREVDNAIDNLNTVVTQLRAVPFMKDGKSQGFRVFAIQPGSIFDKMGLHNGDVIQRVNGQALTDPARAAGLLDAVQTLDLLRVDILRAGKPSTYSYRIQ